MLLVKMGPEGRMVLHAKVVVDGVLETSYRLVGHLAGYHNE